MTTSAASLSHAARLLEQARLAIALTGAGISTPSGIPDFRSPASGLWAAADPLVVASLDGFRRDPRAFYDWIRPLARQMLAAQPNAAHYALADLEARGMLAAVITQNIDLLHGRAGSRRVLELHGHIRVATCLQCGAARPGEPLLRRFVADGQPPLCPDCGGVLKPNVVLFGEELPLVDYEEARRLARRCDLMLVAGSSLEVWPVNELPRLARAAGARLVIVNRESTPLDGEAEVLLRADVAEALPALAALLPQTRETPHAAR
jgi:NAD-dependent deacetylase